jgi:hypothetical protein
VDAAGNPSDTFSQKYTVDPSGPQLIASSLITAPEIFGNKILFAESGAIWQRDLVKKENTPVVVSVYNYKLGDFDPVNGRVIYGYSAYPYIGDVTRGLLVYDMVYGQVAADVYGPGVMDNGSAVYGDNILYYDSNANTTKMKNLVDGSESVIGPGDFLNRDLSVDKVVYSDARGIVLRDIASGSETVIDPAINISGLQFSANPNLIYWTEAGAVNGRVYLYDTSAGGKTFVNDGNDPFVYGRMVYFDKQIEDGSRHIFSKDLDSGTVTQYTYSTGFEYNTNPVFNGLVLAYMRDSDMMIRDFGFAPPVITPSVISGNPVSPDHYNGPIQIALSANKGGT